MGEVTKSILFILIISSLAIIGIVSNQSYAGAQMTAAWLIPVIVSGIGFAVVILRKF